LSIATVRTRARSSSAWPPFTSTPSRAARPTAETTATGIEMTREHGHATMSSARPRYVQVSKLPPSATGTTTSASAAPKTSGV
jgi:hypothetical protein